MASRPTKRGLLLLLLLLLRVVLGVAVAALSACDRGCQGNWFGGGVGGSSPMTMGSLPLNVADCPDGLARCSEGVVSVSRLATLPLPCQGPPSACTCPWEWSAQCSSACVADGVELVVERALAERQLCAPTPDAGVLAIPAFAPLRVLETPCEEGERYRCTGGRVIECASSLVLGPCVRGCFAEGTSLADDAVSREAAFAILCSR